MKFGMLVLIILILSGLTMADSPKPTYDLSTPKSAYVAYIKVYYAASADGMRATSTGGDLAFESVWYARLSVVKWRQLSDAAVQRFGQEALKTIKAPDLSAKNLEDSLKTISAAKIDAKEDVAKIEGQEMLRVNGEWRRNLRDLQGGPDEHYRDDYYRWMAERNKAIVEAWTKLVTEVSDGKYATVADVEAARKKAVTEIDAKLSPPTPTTKPTPAEATTKQ